ncbi:MAG: hypothetical protein JWO82_3945 [Akkermansiaceae bacterium]|nr:hypothetical protein [Akkermansiaceae bacterium]
MDDASAFSDLTPDDSEERAGASAGEARTARQLAMLQELAEIGMQMARAVRDEALARAEAAIEDAAASRRPSPFGGGDLGLVYSRIARAVRQTLALETRLAEGIETAKFEQRRAHVAAVRSAFQERQDEVRDYVAEAIEAEAAEKGTPEKEIERLLDDLDERLEVGDYDEVLPNLPIGDLVERICADLGVTPDWSLWESEDWAIEYEKSLPPFGGNIGADRWRHLEAADPPPPEATGPPPDSG